MMTIDFKHTGVSNLIKDYLAEENNVCCLFNRFPHEENYNLQATDKLKSYKHRDTLHKVLSQQMSYLGLTDKQRENLKKLGQSNTLTVTTGHQLNLLTGPLYFVYKILHTIKICDELNSKNTEFQYVPIYWMATEDHDFDEINHFNTYQNKYSYNAEDGGFVGDIPAKNAIDTLKAFIETLPENKFGTELKEIILKAYSEQRNLAEATRELVHRLLGEFGILILDGNSHELKKLMIPYFEKELKESKSQSIIQETNKLLEKYNAQAYAREINLFFLHNNKRERIEKIKGNFVLNQSLKSFTEEELLSELNNNPEKFSPNVILRPLYQEVILPNVAYVGGGGEIAYWLQLKGVFELYKVEFPMLVVRNSMLILPNAIKHKTESLGLLSEKMFQSRSGFKTKLTKENSDLFDELDLLKTDLENKFNKLETIAQKAGDDFAQMVQAQKKKQLNGYEKLNKRLINSEQKKQKDLMNKTDEVFDYIFPKNSWQERVINFSEFYKTTGSSLFNEIYDAMDTFNSSYHILTIDAILK